MNVYWGLLIIVLLFNIIDFIVRKVEDRDFNKKWCRSTKKYGDSLTSTPMTLRPDIRPKLRLKN